MALTEDSTFDELKTHIEENYEDSDIIIEQLEKSTIADPLYDNHRHEPDLKAVLKQLANGPTHKLVYNKWGTSETPSGMFALVISVIKITPKTKETS